MNWKMIIWVTDNETVDQNDQWLPVLHQSQLFTGEESCSVAHVFPLAKLTVEINQDSGLELPVGIRVF